jgi:hypothetical protein
MEILMPIRSLQLLIGCAVMATQGSCAPMPPATNTAACLSPALASLQVERSSNSKFITVERTEELTLAGAYLLQAPTACRLSIESYDLLENEIKLSSLGTITLGAAQAGTADWSKTMSVGPFRAVGARPAGATPRQVPSLRGMNFVRATPVPGLKDAYVGVWQTSSGNSVAAAFKVSNDRAEAPQILARSSRRINDVFVGPSIHGDRRWLGISFNGPSSSAVGAALYEWSSARTFHRFVSAEGS